MLRANLWAKRSSCIDHNGHFILIKQMFVHMLKIVMVPRWI